MQKTLEFVQKCIFCYWRLHWPNLQTFRNYPEEGLASPALACPLCLAALHNLRLARWVRPLSETPHLGLGVAATHPPPARLLNRWAAKGLQIGNNRGLSDPCFSVHANRLYTSGRCLLPLGWKRLIDTSRKSRTAQGLVALTVIN